MSEYRFISLRERPELKGNAAKWFSSKWGVPEEAYLEFLNYLIPYIQIFNFIIYNC